jgi:hypothetical protein
VSVLEHLSEPAKHIADASAAVVAVGALANLLPSIAALFTILWLGIRIWESDTVRAVTNRQIIGKRAED